MSLGGGKSQSTTDVRLNGININQSSYGNAIPLVYGQNRIPLTLFWYNNFIATPHTQTQSGGKGGGGGSSNTTFTYSASMIMGLAEGPMSSPIGQVFQDKVVTTLAALGLTAFTGAGGQAVWSYLTTNFPSQAIPYDHTAYVAVANYALGSSAAIPNFTFEYNGFVPVGGGVPDAEPSAILVDYCTEPNHGCGFNALGAIQGVGATTFQTYCIAMGFYISPYEATQRPAVDFIKEILQITNSDGFMSAGSLNITPYADASVTGGGRTYTPNLAPLFAFTEDDLMAGSSSTGNDPIVVNRKPLADTYNTVRVEYLDRSHAYNIAIAEATDAQDIALNGVRVMSTLSFHSITTGSVAQNVARLILQRQLFIRSEFTFAVRPDYSLLEPMDLVSLTDPNLGFVNKLVRLTQVVDDENDFLTMTAEDMLVGTASAPLYDFQLVQGYADNWGIVPPSVATPLLFAAPPLLVSENGGYEVWAAVDQGAAGSWGGADVYTSLDNVSYIYAGTINGAARYGTLTSALPFAADPDTTNTLQVTLTNPTTTTLQLVSGSVADYTNLRTLIYVDAEIMAYQTAALTSAGHYNLTKLRRGLYGSVITSQPSGGSFARIDAGIFRMPYDVGMTGQTMYFKFCSFNSYGKAHQSLASATAYPYLLQNNNAGQLQPGALTLVGNNITTAGPTAFKSGGADGTWDASVYTDQSYTNGCSMSAYCGQVSQGLMIGLSYNPAASDSYTNLAYAFFCLPGGALRFYESGVDMGLAGITYTPSTQLNVAYDGKHVAYYANGVLVRTVPLTQGTFFGQICFSMKGDQVYGIEFTAVATATTALSLINFNANSVCVGTRASKVAGGDGTWDTAVYSQQFYTNGCSLSGNTAVSFGSMLGLSVNPTASASYTNLNFAFYTLAGNYYIYESGAQILNGAGGSSWGAYTNATLFNITYDGKHISYYVGGALLRTVAITNQTYYAMVCLGGIHDQIQNLDFGPLTMGVAPFTLIAMTNSVACSGTRALANAFGANGYGNKCFRSKESYSNGAIVSAQIQGGGAQFIGLAPNPVAGDTSGNFVCVASIYPHPDVGQTHCILNGVNVHDVLTAPAPGDVFTLEYDLFFFYWFINNTLVYQAPWVGAPALYLFGDMYEATIGFLNISFYANGRLSPNPWVASGLNAVTHDSSAAKIGGVIGWDSAVYSLNAYTTAHIQAKVNPIALNMMVGLTATPPPISGNSAYTSMGYSWYSTASTTWQIYEGVTYLGSFGAAAVTDMVAVTYDGSTVTYWLNGVSRRTVSVAGLTVYGMVAFYNPGATVNSLAFGPGIGIEKAPTAGIDDNAVSQIGSNFSAAAVSNASSVSGIIIDTTIITAPVITTIGSPIAIDVTTVVSWISGGNAAPTQALLSVYRDGVIIASSQFDASSYIAGRAATPGFPITLSITDLPVAGSHTYTLHYRGQTSGTTGQITASCINNFIKVREVKR